MKHDLKITLLLLTFFLTAQIIGLLLLSLSSQQEINIINNQQIINVSYEETAMGERPQFTNDYGPLVYLMIGVAVGTLIIFALMKVKFGGKLWKYWYFLAAGTAITVSLGVIINSSIAIITGFLLTFLKIKKPTFWIHNITEILMYAGIGLLFAPLFTVIWASVLLILISIYDMVAVWKSKHMISLAKFTIKNKLFAGLMINYKQTKNKTKILFEEKKDKKILIEKISKPKKQLGIKKAILGGGDVVFPLIFTGAVFTELLQLGNTKLIAFLASLIIIITTTIALYLLFYLGKKNKFYPAMPFVSIGCFIGYLPVSFLFILF